MPNRALSGEADESYGATILTPGPGHERIRDKAVRLANQRLLMPDQFNNQPTSTHVQTTAVEIPGDTGGRWLYRRCENRRNRNRSRRVLKASCPTLKSMRQNRKAPPLERRIGLQPQDPGISASLFPATMTKPVSTRSDIKMRTFRHPRSPLRKASGGHLRRGQSRRCVCYR